MAESDPVRTIRPPNGATTDSAWDVLISYAWDDSEWVGAIDPTLSESGFQVFNPHAAPGEFWGRSLDSIVSEVFPARCPVALVVLSSAYRSSEPCLRELDALMSAEAGDPAALVLPVRIDDSPIPGPVRHLAALDARDIPASEVAPRLATRLREEKETTGLDSSRSDQIRFSRAADFNANPRRDSTSGEIDRIRGAIDLLDEKERLLIELFYMDSLQPEDIAERLKISKISFYRLRLRALSKLHDLLRVEP